MYHTWKNLVEKKLVNLTNRELFALIFLTNIHKMYLAYALTAAYLPKFSLPIAFTGMVHQIFPPPKFLMYSTLTMSRHMCTIHRLQSTET